MSCHYVRDLATSRYTFPFLSFFNAVTSNTDTIVSSYHKYNTSYEASGVEIFYNRLGQLTNQRIGFSERDIKTERFKQRVKEVLQQCTVK